MKFFFCNEENINLISTSCFIQYLQHAHSQQEECGEPGIVANTCTKCRINCAYDLPISFEEKAGSYISEPEALEISHRKYLERPKEPVRIPQQPCGLYFIFKISSTLSCFSNISAKHWKLWNNFLLILITI